MIFEFAIQDTKIRFDDSQGVSLAIPMDFDGKQPNHFGAPTATRSPLVLGEFVGSTREGSGCNVDEIRLIPHCNGTHTETVSHIVDELVPVEAVAPTGFLKAILVSVPSCSAEEAGESYRPSLEPADRVITRSAIEAALADQRFRGFDDVDAMVVRMLPNGVDPQGNEKSERIYSAENQPAFFTVEAIEWINGYGIDHLVIDLPSVDRMYDGGLLTNHHLFWNVEEKSHTLGSKSFTKKTITELAFVPDELGDGCYLLTLQVPGFRTDAAPSNPILFPIEFQEV